MAKGDVSIEPAEGVFSITPDDDDFFRKTRAISVDEAGAVHLQMANGTEGSPFLAAGILHPLQIVKVYEDSAAVGIWGYF